MADGSVRVQADADVCFASGFCSRIAPTIFSPDPDGVVTLPGALDGEGVVVSGADVAAAKEAASACPSEAITVTDTS